MELKDLSLPYFQDRPGYLYTPKYFGIITDDGSIKITNSQYLIEAFGEMKKC